MKVIIPKDHQLHDPITILDGWNFIPAFEIALRVDSICNKLRSGSFEFLHSGEFSERTEKAAKSTHSKNYFDFLSSVYQEWSKTQEHDNGVIPYHFNRNSENKKDLGIINEVGLHSYDTCTPIFRHTFTASLNSVECALTASDHILRGDKSVYALCRPPGHHSGKEFYGGFCYLNNSAISAKYILEKTQDKKIAILDLDYHHGNGTQDIFYDTNEVLYVSIHADPKFDYPYSWGTKNETGTGKGKGYNINLPLDLGCDEKTYLSTLDTAISKINEFSPDFLIISLGVDTHINDPVGSFKLSFESFTKMGSRFKNYKIPVLIVQEGGYDLNSIGTSVSNFLSEF
ncbi:MAG: histone deacetylase family protein [Candidatus Delongbacteria bacterium]|nr:histone deacetylase family protein [Candidatus Delongbacteria bacterium]